MAPRLSPRHAPRSRRPITVMLSSLLAACLLIFHAADTQAANHGKKDGKRPPNFIIIFCDDLGYADIGCFGQKKHKTPNIDRMAEQGIRLTSFYSTCGVCSPSRASLMTGCYPKRVNLHQNEHGGWVLFPGDQRGLNPSEITIAEVLKAKGYATGMVGKWHLGDQPAFLPTRQGFDSYFGIPFSNDMGHDSRKKPYRYPPLPLLRNEKVIETEPDQRLITQHYTTEAVNFIKANKSKPFFLYMPHTMPHWPQYSSEKFAGKSGNGKWGDCIEEIDWSVGEVLKALKEAGVDEHTLVLFTSDNGGALNHGANNAPLRGGKGSTWEGGQRIPCVVRWPGKIPAGTTNAEMAVTFDLLPTFAKLAGTAAPSDRKIDGKDIWPLMSNAKGAKTPHDRFFYYHRGNLQAVRSGNWKMFVSAPRRRGKGAPQATDENPWLFDLAADIGESKNIAKANPKVIAQLRKLVADARTDLGDDAKKIAGKNTRKPGDVPGAKPLTSNKLEDKR